MEEHDQTWRISQPNVQSTKHSIHLDRTPAASASASAPSSPSSSPSHEFSFTFTLHPRAKHDSKTKHSPPDVADVIDLSPASEIFFRGHLVPLHSLPGPASLPRFSTSSQGSFTLPIQEINDDDDNNNNKNNRIKSRHVAEEKNKKKSKPFSSFLGIGKKEREDSSSNDNDNDDQNNQKRKSRFEVIKKCARSVKALLTPGGRRREIAGEFIRQQSYSISGDVRVSEKRSVMRGIFSGPVSMRASPRHSGMLAASGASTPPRKSDATMEEMQEAIQAAIAHCKN